MSVLLLTGDCREIMWERGPFDMIMADPPYGDTSLSWDALVRGWEPIARELVKPTGSMWVFGSMRFFMATHGRILDAGWKYAQDIVWEKHNGSGLHADRFKRVHEHALHFYRDDAPWGTVFNDVQKTADATARTVRRKSTPAHHQGRQADSSYASEEGGPRIMRSVIAMRSCHGMAIHPTEKPVGLLQILIRTSCPPGGLVGDFFAGSGAAGEACATSNRNYVGCEVDPVMAEKARDRLSSNLFSA
jgi:site-specific DNA-methyltransferase (adenine-specific)